MGISERKRLESLYEIARALHNQNLNIQAVLQTVLSLTGAAISATHGCVLTLHEDNTIDNAFVLGEAEQDTQERHLWNQLITHGLIGLVHHARRTVVIRDLRTDPRWPELPPSPLIPKTGSAVGLSLHKTGMLHGVMVLLHESVDYFDQDMVDMLEAIANIASAAIGNAVEFRSAHDSRERYKWLFADSVMPVILTDLDGNLLDANKQACDFLGYEHNSIPQLHITAIHRMGTGALGVNRFAVLKDGQQLEFRTNVWTARGDDVPVMVRARRIKLNDQEVIEWIEQDISTTLELEQLRADLAAMVYHDLRGPLNSINISLSAIRRLVGKDKNADPRLAEFIEAGVQSTQQLSRMVESLLDIQRLEEGKAVLDRKLTSLHGLIADAVQLVQPLALEAQQRLIFAVNNDMPFVELDANMITRVITNLVENAIKYTPEGGTIRIKADPLEDEVRISVSDSGPGIPSHMHKRIFDKFSRVKYDDVPKGVGLGLAFCRLAVEAHKGHIWVESESGQGSKFCFALPLDPLASRVG